MSDPPVRPPSSRGEGPWSDAAALVMRPVRSLLGMVVGDEPPLELQVVGRLVLQAIAVGLTVGAAGCLFLLGLDVLEELLLDDLADYPRLRALGEHGDPQAAVAGSGRLWIILFLPMIGAFVAGLVSRWAPEIRGGGGDAMIDAFHHRGGAIRRRVILLKPLASMATLATGGAGGREGPTMHLGGALGAWVAGLLPTTARERRVLMIAGVAAGISAVFRTPLGAALLAIEVLYRDDFESEALIPAVLASVVAYSLSATLLSTSPMFGRLPEFPFRWEHLPLYAVAAVLVAAAAAAFVEILRTVQRASVKLPGPDWLRPVYGGAALGVLAVAILWALPRWSDVPASHLAALGGGYGSAQLAITGSDALGAGATAALVLIALAAVRVFATALTVGTGGSAGDFAPSLAIGAVIGGAIGHAATIWFDIPGISPGAFAMVGMAAFYGGIAKVPLAATVMVCEMAGSYDLLVPLMLVQAIAFVALRRIPLYTAQLPAQRNSPAHAHAWVRRELVKIHAGELLALGRKVATLRPGDATDDVLQVMADAPAQQVFPVVDDEGILRGLVTGSAHRELAAADDELAWAVAADLMIPPVSVPVSAPLAEVARTMLERDLRAIPVVDAAGHVLGLIDEHDVSRAYLGASDDVRKSREMRAMTEPPP